jgi:hypothetical protein
LTWTRELSTYLRSFFHSSACTLCSLSMQNRTQSTNPWFNQVYPTGWSVGQANLDGPRPRQNVLERKRSFYPRQYIPGLGLGPSRLAWPTDHPVGYTWLNHGFVDWVLFCIVGKWAVGVMGCRNNGLSE